MHIKHQHGFTLIEVLVAIAIFAVLSAMGWMVFDQMLKNRDRNAQHAVITSHLQMAYSQLLRDFSQTVPLIGSEGDQSYPALRLQNDKIQFNRSGVIDPLKQGLDEFQYVEYYFDVNKQALMRAQQSNIYRKQNQNLQGDVILAPIENLSFQALDPDRIAQWPATSITDTNALSALAAQLPKGIEVNFTYQDKPYRWVFSLVTALPEQAVQSTINNDNKAEANANTQSTEN